MNAPARSMLFVPGDSEHKLEKAMGTGADALIIDLEDSVSETRKSLARELTREFLESHISGSAGPQLWVRVNPLHSPHALSDLATVVRAAPSGIVVPKIDGPQDLTAIGHHLDALEVAYGVAPGSVKLLPVVTETPVAALNLAALGTDPGSSRVYGFTWGAEDLSAAVGASTNLAADGTWALTYQFLRSQTLLAAKAAAVHAVETLYADITDLDGLMSATRAARIEGFTGRIAVHPRQVDVINEAFTPSAEEVDYAQRVVEAFASDDTGTAALDGKMLDAPHLRQARHVLASVAR